MSSEPPGPALALTLLQGFRLLVDGLHAELARHGHPDLRPVHGFALQALGPDGATTVELARRLGMSKQAAAKHVAALEELGYVRRDVDAADARRRPVRLTPSGLDVLTRSAAIFDDLRAGWAHALGADRLRALEADLRTVTRGEPLRVDTAGWFGG